MFAKHWKQILATIPKHVVLTHNPSNNKAEEIDQVYSNTRVPTRINTGQHESDTILHESTQINPSPTRVQHESTQVRHESTRVNTNQHDSNTSQDEATRVQNRSRP